MEKPKECQVAAGINGIAKASAELKLQELERERRVHLMAELVAQEFEYIEEKALQD